MPVINHVVLASGAVVAVSVVVATAIAIFENPEVRRYGDDVRRRIAMALHQLGEGIAPPTREPRFNRPEDAEGFMESRRGVGAEPGVDADDETRKRQREELMYWNSVHLQKQQQDGVEADQSLVQRPRGLSFDDFLHPVENSEEGAAYVFNSSMQIHENQNGLRQRSEGTRGLAAAASVFSNPFADEYYIGNDELEGSTSRAAVSVPVSVPVPAVMPGGFATAPSDIYSATTKDDYEFSNMIPADSQPALIDIDAFASEIVSRVPVLESQSDSDEYMTAGQEDRQDAYASIQAWAHDSSRNFYSPLPETPVAPISEADDFSDGQLTPTDTMSLADSGEDVGHDAVSSLASNNGRQYDVMSQSSGMATPASWSEIGSVVSENDGHIHA